VPQGQWNLIMQSVAAAGELPTTDVKTAEMEVQVETGVLVSRTLSFLGMSNRFCSARNGNLGWKWGQTNDRGEARDWRPGETRAC